MEELDDFCHIQMPILIVQHPLKQAFVIAIWAASGISRLVECSITSWRVHELHIDSDD